MHLNNLFLSDVISISIIAFYGFPFFKYIELIDLRYLWFGIGMFVSSILTHLIKKYTFRWKGIFVRPRNASKCDIFCRSGSSAGQMAFPSGHMSITTFFFVYWWLLHKTSTSKVKTTKAAYLIAVLSIIYIALMAMARYIKSCHNVVQIVAGIINGAVFACLWFYVGSVVFKLTK